LHFSPNNAIRHHRDPASYFRAEEHLLGAQKYNWTQEYFDNMPIDHFSYADVRTFKLRYLISTEHYRPNGPIFFYTGNEGGIEGFALNTGFMWDIAPEYGAAVVFAEHRFYGKTQPFGNQSYKTVKNLGYLSSEQALADFAQLLAYLKDERISQAKNSPVIAFGGSYGGMLTAWFRIKYPHLVDGGIAASAPVLWFEKAGVPEDIFDRIVTRTMKLSQCNLKAVSAAYEALKRLASTDEGRKSLNELFKFDSSSLVNQTEDGDALGAAVTTIFETLAMVDYPYEANFLSPLPAWPMKEVCKHFTSKEKKDKELAYSMYQVMNTFYNHTGQKKTFCFKGPNCGDPFSQLGDPAGWPWQSCTEMVMPLCASGPPNDIFPKSCPFTNEGALNSCGTTFNSIGFKPEMFRPDWVIDNYGERYPTASNIVFSNGYLDPWSGGGWSLKPATKGTLVSIIIEDGAHHLDLRGAHPDDTNAVKEARRIEKLHISRWIREAEKRNRKRKNNWAMY
jgi:lysosomal Pro-X carboxypeptidase